MRKSILAAAAFTLSLIGAWALFDAVPRWRSEAAASASRRLYEEFGCARSKPVPARLNVNLLQNPGLEGPCGWAGNPFKRAWIASIGSRSGNHHFQLKSKGDVIWQEVDLTSLAPRLADKCCAVTFSGFVKLEVRFGRTAPSDNPLHLHGVGNPAFYLSRKTSVDNDYFLDRPGLGYSSEWEQRVTREWLLDGDIRSLKITLGRWDEYAFPLATAHFDDISLIIHHRGEPALDKSSTEPPRL